MRGKKKRFNKKIKYIYEINLHMQRCISSYARTKVTLCTLQVANVYYYICKCVFFACTLASLRRIHMRQLLSL